MTSMRIEPTIACTNCNSPNPFCFTRIDAYLGNKQNNCSQCAQHIDWWEACLRHLDPNQLMHMPGMGAFSIIGLGSISFKLLIKEGTPLTYKFSEHGIPKGSKILYVNYTPNDAGLWPVEMHGNVASNIKYSSDEVCIAPFANREKKVATTEVSVLITYLDNEQWQEMLGMESVDLNNYLELFSLAISSFVNGDFPASAISSCAPNDIISNEVVKAALSKRYFKKKKNDFADRLKTHIHEAVQTRKLSIVPQAQIDLLDKLRMVRNDMAHEGRTKKSFPHKEQREMILASIFSFRYFWLLKTQMQTEAILDKLNTNKLQPNSTYYLTKLQPNGPYELIPKPSK
jgi:hypothetical protein